jgi:hypothetical protein
MAAAILGAVIGSFITLAGGFALYFLVQRQRKQLGWRVLSASVIIPKLRNPMPNITIAAKPALLGKEGEELIPIEEEILGYRIQIRNTGNQVIDEQSVTFTMTERPQVLSIEPESLPDFGGRDIKTTVQDPTPNVAVTVLPYLNPRQEVVFSIQCLGDRKAKCRVSAGAPGLVLQDIVWARRLLLLYAAAAVCSLLLLAAGIARLLIETGDIARSETTRIDNYLIVAGVIAGTLLAVGLLNLFSGRVESPEAAEKARQASRSAGQSSPY